MPHLSVRRDVSGRRTVDAEVVRVDSDWRELDQLRFGLPNLGHGF